METITDRLNRRSLELNVSQADIIRATGDRCAVSRMKSPM